MDEELDQFEPKAPSEQLKTDTWADLSLCSHLRLAPPLAGYVEHTRNPSNQEAKAGKSQGSGHSQF